MALEPFVTDDEFAEYLDLAVEELPSGSDLALDAAMQSVRMYMQQDLTYAVTTEYHEAKGQSKIRLRQRPVVAIGNVVIGDTPLGSTEYTLRGSFLKFAAPTTTWCLWPGEIAVTYSHGYDVSGTSSDIPGFPTDIKWVTLSAAARILRGMDEDPTKVSESIGNYSYTREGTVATTAANLLLAERSVLDWYTVRLIP